MSRVSKRKPHPKIKEAIEKDFWQILDLLEDFHQIEEFFKELLTPMEIKMLSKRIQVGVMLVQGYDYKVISQSLKVTDGTIARINHQIQDGQWIRKILEKFLDLEKDVEKESLERDRLSFNDGKFFKEPTLGRNIEKAIFGKSKPKKK